MLDQEINAGDLRVKDIDYDRLARETSNAFVDYIRGLGHEGKSGRRGITFFKTEDNDEFYCVFLARGFYSELHDITHHDDIYYLQFIKADRSFITDRMSTQFLKRFAPIGITVTE